MKLLKYFQIIGEMDYIHWQLNEWLKEEKKLKPIEKMIDNATGFNKEKTKLAFKLIKRFKKLKKFLEENEVKF